MVATTGVVQLVEDAAGMGFDGLGGDGEALGDLAGGITLADQGGDLALARGEGGPVFRYKKRHKKLPGSYERPGRIVAKFRRECNIATSSRVCWLLINL